MSFSPLRAEMDTWFTVELMARANWSPLVIESARPNSAKSLPDAAPRGFTLVEMMVTVSIIAVLAAILLPSLGRARAQAFQVKCASNLKSCGQGILYYSLDSYVGRGRLPNFWGEQTDSYPGAYWATQIRPFVKFKRSRVGTRDSLLRCPADETPNYAYITGPKAGTAAFEADKLAADGRLRRVASGRRSGPRTVTEDYPDAPLIEPVSYYGACMLDWRGVKLTEIRRPHCEVLLSEVRRHVQSVCFTWTAVRDARGEPMTDESMRRHYGGTDPNHHGSNWLFADLHVRWQSMAYAQRAMLCCQTFRYGGQSEKQATIFAELRNLCSNLDRRRP